jgi:hypothetical protein
MSPSMIWWYVVWVGTGCSFVEELCSISLSEDETIRWGKLKRLDVANEFALILNKIQDVEEVTQQPSTAPLHVVTPVRSRRVP